MMCKLTLSPTAPRPFSCFMIIKDFNYVSSILLSFHCLHLLVNWCILWRIRVHLAQRTSCHICLSNSFWAFININIHFMFILWKWLIVIYITKILLMPFVKHHHSFLSVCNIHWFISILKLSMFIKTNYWLLSFILNAFKIVSFIYLCVLIHILNNDVLLINKL